MPNDPMTPRRPYRLPIWPHSISPRTRVPRLRTMDDRPFDYYPPQYSSYPSTQYQQPPYDSDYVSTHNNPFVDHAYTAGQTQDETQSWSPFESTNPAATSLQRRGAVSDSVIPEGGAAAEQGGLRVDVSGGDNGEHHVHKVCIPPLLHRSVRFGSWRSNLSRWPKTGGIVMCAKLGWMGGEGSGTEAYRLVSRVSCGRPV